MRACGECRACCTILAVEEIGKALHQPCRHLCGHGCAIYDARPVACRDFSCLWLTTDMAEKERPDLSGVMLERAQASARGTGLSPIAAYERAPGAFDGYWGRKILKRLARKHLVALIPFGCAEPREVLGPPEQVGAGIEWTRR